MQSRQSGSVLAGTVKARVRVQGGGGIHFISVSDSQPATDGNREGVPECYLND